MGGNTFLQHLQEVLHAHPAGLSEFELIKQLQASNEPGFESDCLQDNLSLFQTHFFLFHSLYQLHNHLSQHGAWQLNISALCIQLIPASDEDGYQLAHADPLRAYYLDLNNLENTAADEVEALLDQFWQQFLRNDERRDALNVLQLEDPVDWAAIKHRHRQLAMQHHPDRGGDTERLQAINAAMEILARAQGKKQSG